MSWKYVRWLDQVWIALKRQSFISDPVTLIQFDWESISPVSQCEMQRYFLSLKNEIDFVFSVCHIAGGVQVNSDLGHWVMIINRHWQVRLVTFFIASIDILEKIPRFIWLFEIIDEIFWLRVCMFFVVDIDCIYDLYEKKSAGNYLKTEQSLNIVVHYWFAKFTRVHIRWKISILKYIAYIDFFFQFN